MISTKSKHYFLIKALSIQNYENNAIGKYFLLLKICYVIYYMYCLNKLLRNINRIINKSLVCLDRLHLFMFPALTAALACIALRPVLEMLNYFGTFKNIKANHYHLI